MMVLCGVHVPTTWLWYVNGRSAVGGKATTDGAGPVTSLECSQIRLCQCHTNQISFWTEQACWEDRFEPWGQEPVTCPRRRCSRKCLRNSGSGSPSRSHGLQRCVRADLKDAGSSPSRLHRSASLLGLRLTMRMAHDRRRAN